MDEVDILKKISSNLTERKSSAALSNYLVLCNNIEFLNRAFSGAIVNLRELHYEITSSINSDSLLKASYKSDTDLNSFIPIVARLQLNSLSIFEKLASVTKKDNRTQIDLDSVSELSRGFDDYNSLVTTARQYIDSIVSDSYQLYLLDPKSFNYHVLVSLNSFKKYATKSLTHSLFNPEVETALSEFETIEFRDWKKSHITECKHTSFGQKVDFLFSEIGNPSDSALPESLKNIFKFSSEFTHIGYISTFFSSTSGTEVIFGDEDGPYLPSTENFSELKYEILETSCKALVSIYIPSLIICLKKLLLEPKADCLASSLRATGEKLSEAINTRNSEYYFFVKSKLIGSSASIALKCMCGKTKHWAPPHEASQLYCDSCGSSFKLLEIDSESGYIITSAGPVKIIGSNVPDFDDLPESERIELLEQCEKVNKTYGA